MADQPLAPPPSYEEVVGSATYYPPPNLFSGDVPPPYSYVNNVYIPTTQPPGSSAVATQGSSENSTIFMVRPPGQTNQIDPIPPKPSTPSPSVNPTPAANRTPAANPTPATTPNPAANQTPAAPRNPSNRPQNSNAGRQSFENQEVKYDFFKKMYMILFVQAVCSLSLGAGIYSSKDTRNGIASNNGMGSAAVGTTIASIFLVWITTELRKTKKPFCIVFMILFTMVLSYCLMVLTCVTRSIIPLIVVGIVAILCIFTILFLHQKKITFTLISGMIFTLIVVAVLSGIAAVFNPVSDCAISGGAALAFSWWVMLITWCMVQDHKKNRLQPDQYLSTQPFIYAGIVFLPWILIGIIFCKFEWKKYK